jgi:hypothetical protein
VDAISIAKYGLAMSPTNYQFKLLLLRLYRLAGAGDALFKMYETLDVKHVLLDTLSFLALPPCWQVCAPLRCLSVLAGVWRWCRAGRV